MKTEIFEIETENGFDQFEGITFGQRWNGWECPQFDIHNIKKILDGIGTEEQAKECNFSFYEYCPTYDVIIEKVYWDGKLEAIDTSKPILVDGIKYYALGCMNWTWSKA